MVITVHHFGVAVQDMERSLAFYKNALGATIGLDLGMELPAFGRGVGIPGAQARVVFLQVPGMAPQLELIQYLTPQGRAGGAAADVPIFGTIHAALQVGDIQRAYEELQAKGVRFDSQPSRFPADHPLLGGVAFCYFRDPDGALLELIEFPA